MGHFKDNYKREKAEMNRLTDENSLWARLKGKPLTDAQVDFLQSNRVFRWQLQWRYHGLHIPVGGKAFFLRL